MIETPTASLSVPWFVLVPPSGSAGDVPRRGVSAALDVAVARGPLTVVSAPPGFGKSVAVAQWARSRGDVGWVTAPAAPDQAARCVEAGVWAAVDAAEPRLGVLAEGPDGSGVGRRDRDALAARIAALPRPAVLVVDDAHLVRRSELERMLLTQEILGSGMLRIVLVGGLRLRAFARRATTLFNTLDLAFTLAEATEIAGSRAAELHLATRGWPIAVRFALMAGRRGRSACALDEDHSMLTEYVGEVVLPSFSAAVRAAVLDGVALGAVFDAELAEWVLGADVVAVLDEIATGVFLDRSIEDGRLRYHWHEVVVLHCGRLARRRDPDRVRRVEWAAADALRADDPLAACRFALSAGDARQAHTILVEGWGRALLSDARALDVLCASLPAPFDRDPDAMLIRACARRVMGDVTTAGHLQALARAATPVDQTPAEPGSPAAAVAAAFLAEESEDVADALDAADVALAAAAPGASPVTVAYARFLARWTRVRRLADPVTGAALMAEEEAAATALGLDDLAAVARVERAVQQVRGGAMAAALSAVESAFETAVVTDWTAFQVDIDLARGCAALWRGDVEEAVDRLQDVLHGREKVRGARHYAAVHLAVAVADCGREDLRAVARAAVAQLPDDDPLWRPYRRVAMAQLLASAGQDGRAAAVVAPLAEEELEPVVGAMLAALLRNIGLTGSARRAVGRAKVTGGGARADAIIAVTEALLAADRGDHGAALSCLERALDSAAGEGVVLPLLCPDETLDTLLRHGVRGREAVVSELLERRADVRRSPLTDREADVLEALRTTLSTAEIAVELGVSVNTLKTHLRSIYRKLGAGSRREALRRADRAGTRPADRRHVLSTM